VTLLAPNASLAKLTAKHYHIAHVDCLAILSWNCSRHFGDGNVCGHKATNFPRRDVRDMDFLRSVALSELQNFVQEEPDELVAFALNNLP
jgi:hypothetical protein